MTPFSYIGPSVCSSKKKSKKKGRTLAFERVKLPTLGKKCLLFPERRRWLLLLRWRRKKKCEVDDDKEKSKKKKGKKLARASQNSPVYSNPLCPFFPKSVFSFICHFTFPRYKNHFVSLQEKKRKKKAKWWMKRAAHSRNARTANRRESRNAVFFFFFTRARARVRKEENARKKHLSIFSLSRDTKSTNLVRFFFFVPTTKRYGKRVGGGRRSDLSFVFESDDLEMSDFLRARA